MRSLLFEALARMIAGQLPAGPVRPNEVDLLEAGPITGFFGLLEMSRAVNNQTHQEYFLKPALMDMQRGMRDRIVENWTQGGPPLTIAGIFNIALSIAGDPGTSLLLCHNMLKSMARGSDKLPWNRVRDWPTSKARPAETGANLFPKTPSVSLPIEPDDYTDGVYYYRPKILNASSNSYVKVNNPKEKPASNSIWYLLFDRTSYDLGTADAGDWYHFFLTACLGYFAITDRVSNLDGEGGLDTDTAGAWYFTKNLIEGIQCWECRPETFLTMNSKRRAWVWTNALSYLEGSFFGAEVDPDDPDALPTWAEKKDVLRESEAHRAGLLYGMLEAAPDDLPDPNWNWWVPMPGRLRAAAVKGDLPEKNIQIKQIGPGISGFTYGYFQGQKAPFYPWGTDVP